MVEKFSVHITPFDLERTVQVYLPDDWQTSRQKYPVLYMFDGHNLFFDQDATYGKSWGLKEFLDGWDKKIILGGVEGNKEGDGRLREYCPYRQRGWLSPDFEGCGQEYMEWLCGELKPLIDKKYPTLPGRSNTGIAGSSMGGLMSLWALVHWGDVFGKAGCLSCAFQCCWEPLRAEMEQYVLRRGARAYLSWGSRESSPETVEFLGAATLESAHILSERGVKVYPFMQVGGGHCEADWERQLPRMMNWLFEK